MNTLDPIAKLTDQNQTFEGAPLDFTEFLSRRFHMQPSEVVAMLGECLLGYEPMHRYEIVVGPDRHAA